MSKMKCTLNSNTSMLLKAKSQSNADGVDGFSSYSDSKHCEEADEGCECIDMEYDEDENGGKHWYPRMF